MTPPMNHAVEWSCINLPWFAPFGITYLDISVFQSVNRFSNFARNLFALSKRSKNSGVIALPPALKAKYTAQHASVAAWSRSSSSSSPTPPIAHSSTLAVSSTIIDGSTLSQYIANSSLHSGSGLSASSHAVRYLSRYMVCAC